MHISNKVFDPDLIYGRNSQNFLVLGNDEIGVSSTRIGDQPRLDVYLNNLHQQLDQSLACRTVSELKCLATNLSYFLEKRKPAKVPLWTFMVNRYAWFVGWMAVSYMIDQIKVGFFFCIVGCLSHSVKQRILSARSGAPEDHLAIAELILPHINTAWMTERPDMSLEYEDTPQLALDLAAYGFDRANTDQMRKGFLNRRLTKQEILAFRRMLVVRHKARKKQHFVVTHGQSALGGIMVEVLTALMHHLEPCRNLKSFRALRFSRQMQARDDTIRTADQFLKRYPCSMDSLLRTQLLSVSINPWDQTLTESALAMWLEGGGIANNFGEMLFNSVSEHYQLNPLTKIKIENLFEEMTQLILREADPDNGTIGQLYAICIPRDLIHTKCPIYPSFPFGLYNPRKSSQIRSQFYRNWSSNTPCQGRVIAAALLPEFGIKIHAFNTYTPALHKKLHDAVQRVVGEISPDIRPIEKKA